MEISRRCCSGQGRTAPSELTEHEFVNLFERVTNAEGQAAERVIVQAGGINMNTWVVGNAPIGHYTFQYPKLLTNAATKVQELGEKIFFMKARIMAGQADLSKNAYGDSEYKWLSKSEIEKVVSPKYWSSIKNMLAER